MAEADSDLIFYSSENGDDWLLVGGAHGQTVRHRPNVSSGGNSRDVNLKDFLSRERNTPQGKALQEVLDRANGGT
jgi:hypothetical protein